MIPRRRTHPRACAGAFTLVEVLVSMLVVGIMLVAALETVSASLRTQAVAEERIRGALLAEGLLAEILCQAYQEPFELPVAFGPEATETGGTRAAFDDVDDYASWTASPPQAKDGTVLTGLAGWTRSARVVWANPDNLTQTAAGPSGVKRVTVTVARGDKVVATRVAIVTDSWQSPPYQ